MLNQIYISNYALIKNLQVSFSQGFTTITGETGAGKSILMGALGLLLGKRADTSVLQDSKKKCIVEADFLIESYALKEFFEQNDLDYANQTFIRREINPAGRSRAFINDTPVTLSQLKYIGAKLIDIHSQHQTLMLNNHSFQLTIVDAFASHDSLLNKYELEYEKWNQKKLLLKQLKSQSLSQKNDLDYKVFLLNELENASLHSVGELNELEEELNVLENAEEIEQKLNASIYQTQLSEHAVLTQLSNIHSLLLSISSNHDKINTLANRIDSIRIDLNDVVSDLESVLEKTDHNPEKINVLSQRIGTINTLLQKHQFIQVEQLIELQQELESSLHSAKSFEEELSTLEKEVEDCYLSACQLAEKVSLNRAAVIPTIEKEIIALLAEMGMPDAAIKINQHPMEHINDKGKEEVVFYFSANKGSQLQEISKIASGGELSRLMLCIKYLLAYKYKLPTIIFDEIDSGVSGEIAHKMGKLMNQMSQNIQVISITHLPQVAARGNDHLLVTKDNTALSTETSLIRLSKDERIQELAKMLSGSEITQIAIRNAEELLGA